MGLYMFDDNAEARKQREEAVKLLRNLRFQHQELAKKINGVELIVRGYDQLLDEPGQATVAPLRLLESVAEAPVTTEKPTIKSLTLELLKSAGAAGVTREEIKKTLVAHGFLRGRMDPDKYVQWIIASLKQKGAKIQRDGDRYILVAEA